MKYYLSQHNKTYLVILTLILGYSLLLGQKRIPLVLGSGFDGDIITITVDRDTVFSDTVYSNEITGFSAGVSILIKKYTEIRVWSNLGGWLHLTLDSKVIPKKSLIIVGMRRSVHKDWGNCVHTMSVMFVNRKTFSFE